MVCQKVYKRVGFVSRMLMTVLCFVLALSFTACGRRGDPVPIIPQEKNAADSTDAGKDRGVTDSEREGTSQENGTLMPEAPSGLIALYTSEAIVLTWDEVVGQGVKRYKVYRSSGGEYDFIGDTAAPAFTDKEIEPDRKYYYKITAVGVLESGPSEEIEITTEGY